MYARRPGWEISRLPRVPGLSRSGLVRNREPYGQNGIAFWTSPAKNLAPTNGRHRVSRKRVLRSFIVPVTGLG